MQVTRSGFERKKEDDREIERRTRICVYTIRFCFHFTVRDAFSLLSVLPIRVVDILVPSLIYFAGLVFFFFRRLSLYSSHLLSRCFLPKQIKTMFNCHGDRVLIVCLFCAF